ncbi:hypothetical protein GE061_017413 [Apolygus lucorum]|uniref:Glycogen debranching enzyme n=1 Tax=Apolygus lucorum TaxID=248454 RepID=A0A8S9XF00_APOLU|nr:hypothetical protein GE061_017413 [Apolygus lucorum]
MCLIHPFQALFHWVYIQLVRLFAKEETKAQGYQELPDGGTAIKDNTPEVMGGKSYFLDLNKGENLSQQYYRIRRGDTVIFKQNSSLYGCNVKLFSEFPEKNEPYVRGKYRQVFNRVTALRPGSFHYFFTIDGSDTNVDGEGYILVEPSLKIGGDPLPLDCIQCITYLSKCLGPLSSWREKLAVARETGYNMIHFTPIQELGGSNSAYSLRNQLKVSSAFGEDTKSSPSIEAVAEITEELRNQWKMLSICDIVLNHTANESEWLLEHPECAYNLENSPHLRPAYVLDHVLHQFSLDVARGDFETCGVPPAVNCEDHLNAMRYQLGTFLVPKAKIPDMFLIDVPKYVQLFKETISFAEPSKRHDNVNESNIKIIQDPNYKRLGSTINMDLAVNIYNVFRSDCFDEDTRQKKCTESFKSKLDSLNNDMRNIIEDHLRNAVDNCIATVRYFRIDPSGPKIPLVTKNDLLVPRYFEELNGSKDEDAFTDKAKYIAAHNGWVMNYDPLKDFAEPGSNVYLRRELIAWGDSVKLRYGKNKEDCPYLWQHMKEYVETTARVFDGVRLDNCHSTPIHVAQYLLDAARLINPNLFIVAELFTNSDLTDNVFINKLGITSLIREAMSGWDSHEVGRLVYRYGGKVIGAMGEEKASRMAHALFMDITHDNPSPVEKRTVYDLLPTAALVSMASCASGSTAGYDQLVPHHVHVVEEDRNYMSLDDTETCSGIMKAKKALNKLHYTLAKEGYNQVFVDQIDKDIVCVTRQNPITLDSVVLFSYTAFSCPNDAMSGSGKGVTTAGLAHSVILEAFLTHKSNIRFVSPNLKDFTKDPSVINGLSDYVVDVKENIALADSNMIQAVPSGTSTRLNLTCRFKPGTVVAVRIMSRKSAKEAAANIIAGNDYSNAVSKLDFIDLNYALYRHHTEEDGGGPYNIPGFGLPTYCGLQGMMSILEEVARNDDLGHPLCGNLRDGLWLCHYITLRFSKLPHLQSLGSIMEKEFALMEDLPAPLRPWGFYTIVARIYKCLIDHAISLMPEPIKFGNDFAHRLSLCSIQMAGVVRSAPLPPLSEAMNPPKPKTEIDSNGKKRQLTATLAAGLPHFSSGYMRSWGRDTFISLKGLLLLTNRFDEARYIILGYAACLRHGLIPNLLDAYGLKPRYNCRDAVWWWLYSIKEYVLLAPNGTEILKDKVNRIFPKDDSDVTFLDQELSAVMQEALNVHFQGLCFRERNAGIQIDEHMTSAGFDNQIGVHPETGFVFGGNEWNCGTWMDKMGSSVEAGTKGRPATPRDGSAVEIVGLSMAVISWLEEAHLQGLYPHGGVSRKNKNGSTTSWTWADWSCKIKDNFEKEFWVDVDAKGDYVNRRGIYKDSVGATQPWADFRLRPNFTIAMVVAPELFSKERARIALENTKVLVGPLGMKTLDPSDLAYFGDYDNSNNSADSRVAHGFNYHQGPEWVWPVGYYLMAKLRFSSEPEKTKLEIEKYLSTHWSHIATNHWRGLPELTNSNGAFCRDSCHTQAWSASTLLETWIELLMDKSSQ